MPNNEPVLCVSCVHCPKMPHEDPCRACLLKASAEGARWTYWTSAREAAAVEDTEDLSLTEMAR